MMLPVISESGRFNSTTYPTKPTNSGFEKPQPTKSRAAKPNYGAFRQRILKLTPTQYQCKFFCGGSKCRYCSATSWTKEQQAVEGIYSTWITENLMAMARPTTTNMDSFDIIKQFKKQRIVSLVNLQRAYEHKDCSPNSLCPGGFSYDPEEFMKNNIFHYNFGWPDFGTSSLSSLLDMVKVLSFALKQGSVAVHCHAGLGRTGVFIACYLVWEQEMNAAQAISFIRRKRANSIQTSEQVQTVYDFQDFLVPLLQVFQSDSQLSLEEYLQNQRLLLHGVEERILKFIPKIVYVVCERLLELSGSSRDGALDRKLNLLSSGDDIFYYERIVARNPNVSCSQSVDDSNLSDLSSKYSDDGTISYIRTLSHSPKSLRARSLNFGYKPLGKLKSVSFADIPTMVGKEAAASRNGRLPPIALSQSLNLPRNHTKQKKLNFKNRLPWDMYEKAETVLISEIPETDGIDGIIDWKDLIDQCLSTKECPSDIEAAIETYKKHLEHKNESWRKLINEEQHLILVKLLGEWFDSLKSEPIPKSILLVAKDEDFQPKQTSSQKWLTLYLCNVFQRLSTNDSTALIDSISRLLAQWLSRSYDKSVIDHYRTTLNAIAE